MQKTCRHCESEFDTVEKVIRAKANKMRLGKVDECLDCVEDDVEKYTGVMLYGQKTSSEIQINTSAELTQYMLQASPSNRTARVMKMQAPAPKEHAGVQKHVVELEKRR